MPPDAVVVGSGPNGLAAAILLARAGLRTVLREAQTTLGGGLRSAELTLPGYQHDICSAVHPLAVSSPFFRTLPLGDFGLEWVQPPAPLAHPLDSGRAAMLERSLDATAAGLGPGGRAWHRLLAPFVSAWAGLAEDVLAPPIRVPRHPVLMARFGLQALRPSTSLARGLGGTAARALFAGNAAHSFLPLDAWGTGAFGLLLSVAGHAVGWPIARGGSQRLADALLACFRSHGGEVMTGAPVEHLDELRRRPHHHARPGTASGRPTRRRSPARPLPPSSGGLPVRRGRVQDRLGAGRAGTLDRPGVRPVGHGAPRRHARGGGGLRGGPRPRGGVRAPIRALRAAHAVR